MATLMKAINISRTTVYNLSKLCSNLSVTSNVNTVSNATSIRRPQLIQCAFNHTSSEKSGLMEFFDDEDNWTKSSIRVGRAWKLEELRVKSNEDLHKLWYVLLKEQNMLLTMEEIFKNDKKIMPNPERIDKVKVSMENIETAVRERNKAYFMLETGVSGERPAKIVYNQIGLRMTYRLIQHKIPKYLNSGWRQRHQFGFGGFAVRKFLRLFREKLYNFRRKETNRQYNQARTTLRIFPDTNLEALAQKYPQVNMDKLFKSPKVRSHSVPQ